jgi:hypothetical protein
VANFFRHVVSGDRCTVKFRYHKDKGDLEVTVLDMSKKAGIGKGSLAVDGNYKVVSNGNGVFLRGNTLGLWGSEQPNVLPVSYAYGSIESRNNALLGFIRCIDAINGKIPGVSNPWNPVGEIGLDLADPTELDQATIKPEEAKNGGIVLMKRINVVNNLADIMKGELTMPVPGYKAEDITAYQPDGKDELKVVFADGDDKQVETFPLASGYKVNGAKLTVKDGVLNIKVDYNLGKAIVASAE